MGTDDIEFDTETPLKNVNKDNGSARFRKKKLRCKKVSEKANEKINSLTETLEALEKPILRVTHN